MNEPDILAVALRCAEAFEQAGVGYFLGGSLASSLQGEPRATNDIDFVIDLHLPQLGLLARALGQDFDIDEESLRDAVVRRGSWNIFHLPSVTKVDLFQLLWFQQGGESSSTQWRDIVQLLRLAAGDLDMSHIHPWC